MSDYVSTALSAGNIAAATYGDEGWTKETILTMILSGFELREGRFGIMSIPGVALEGLYRMAARHFLEGACMGETHTILVCPADDYCAYHACKLFNGFYRQEITEPSLLIEPWTGWQTSDVLIDDACMAGKHHSPAGTPLLILFLQVTHSAVAPTMSVHAMLTDGTGMPIYPEYTLQQYREYLRSSPEVS